jgi:hypothetical protein
MNAVELTERVEGNGYSGHRQHETDEQAGKGLDAAVAVRVIPIRGFCGERQAEKHNTRSEDIRRGLEAIGDHGSGMTHHASSDLDSGEGAAHQHSGKGDALPGLHPAFSLLEPVKQYWRVESVAEEFA